MKETAEKTTNCATLIDLETLKSIVQPREDDKNQTTEVESDIYIVYRKSIDFTFLLRAVLMGVHTSNCFVFIAKTDEELKQTVDLASENAIYFNAEVGDLERIWDDIGLGICAQTIIDSGEELISDDSTFLVDGVIRSAEQRKTMEMLSSIKVAVTNDFFSKAKSSVGIFELCIREIVGTLSKSDLTSKELNETLIRGKKMLELAIMAEYLAYEAKH